MFFPKPPTFEAGFETKFSKVCHQQAIFLLLGQGDQGSEGRFTNCCYSIQDRILKNNSESHVLRFESKKLMDDLKLLVRFSEAKMSLAAARPLIGVHSDKNALTGTTVCQPSSGLLSGFFYFRSCSIAHYHVNSCYSKCLQA